MTAFLPVLRLAGDAAVRCLAAPAVLLRAGYAAGGAGAREHHPKIGFAVYRGKKKCVFAHAQSKYDQNVALIVRKGLDELIRAQFASAPAG